MNQKDYKEIARIMKTDLSLMCDYDRDNHIYRINKLADYFEREDEKIAIKQTGGMYPKRAYQFNRQQFLKDCGVSK